MSETEAIKRAAAVLESGGVIAYPTEAVYGLGCDPLREDSVNRLLELKGRPREQGLILIASDFAQIETMIDTSDEPALARARATWPGPVTWIFPAREHVPDWLTGGRGTLAVRVTEHRQANALCVAFGRALVSTSANRSGAEPARDAAAVREAFGDELDFILDAPVGDRDKPSEIRDALTGEVIRSG